MVKKLFEENNFDITFSAVTGAALTAASVGFFLHGNDVMGLFAAGSAIVCGGYAYMSYKDKFNKQSSNTPKPS
jgi:hypothetical protein